ncbi:amino acid ABC transporter permease [Kocuria palustris]|uniref:amino acid ABC transporter permease n=1 Tax=Kocuria palustris TaxID=71999 RepID=UPI000738D7A6|nr:amino acid ABC transporter permease [Kocuria palustris]KUG55948.1 amino acid ABC transporter permease [Kocuria palustris]
MDSRSPSTPEPDSPVRVLPARHPWRSLASMLGVIVILVIVWALITNPRWQWGVVAQWFTAESIVRGLGLTLSLTAIAGVAGFVLGFALALLRMSSSPVLAGLAWTYIWIFRSVPLLVQLLLWYNIGYLYETIVLGIPFTDVVLLEASTTELVGKFAAAALGLSLHQAAYAAEIIRGGILSVDAGQLEAAKALGLPAWRRSVGIVLPQALRAILPPAFNEIISLVKGTSIVYVLALGDLFYTAQIIYSRTNEVIPMLMVATIWYIVITTALNIIQYYVERRVARGAVRTLPPTPWQRVRARLASERADARERKRTRLHTEGSSL